MDGFSDGVFSIAATLLVLDISIHPPGTALERLQHAWPAYLAYLVSFLTIGAAWLAHTAMTDRLTRVDSVFLRLNLLLLMWVTLLPFPTKLVGEALRDVEDERVFVTIYGLTLLAIRLSLFGLDAYSRREGLYSREGAEQDEDEEELQTDRRKLLPVLTGYVTAIIVGLFLPIAAVCLYAASGCISSCRSER
jgi:uncharacterized membrane protein